MALTAATSPSSFPQSSTGGVLQRTSGLDRPQCERAVDERHVRLLDPSTGQLLRKPVLK